MFETAFPCMHPDLVSELQKMEFLCVRLDGDRRRHDAALLSLLATHLQSVNEYVMDVNTCWRSLGREVHRKMLMPLVYKYAMCPYTPEFCSACAVEAEEKVAPYCADWDARVTHVLGGGGMSGNGCPTAADGCVGGTGNVCTTETVAPPNMERIARVLERCFALCKAQEQGLGAGAGLQVFFLLTALPKVLENVESVYSA
eukprot:2428200-Rhodomonas_salina.1